MITTIHYVVNSKLRMLVKQPRSTKRVVKKAVVNNSLQFLLKLFLLFAFY